MRRYVQKSRAMMMVMTKGTDDFRELLEIFIYRREEEGGWGFILPFCDIGCLYGGPTLKTTAAKMY